MMNKVCIQKQRLPMFQDLLSRLFLCWANRSWTEVKRGFTTGADCLQHLWIHLSAIVTERSGHACRHEAEIVP